MADQSITSTGRTCPGCGLHQEFWTGPGSSSGGALFCCAVCATGGTCECRDPAQAEAAPIESTGWDDPTRDRSLSVS